MSYETYRRALTPVIWTAYHVEARGQENVPSEGRLVVAANHESMLDPFLLAAVIPRPMRFLGKAELWKVLGLRSWLRSVEAIPVHRGSSDLAAIRSAIEALEADEVVGIFPEGGVRRPGAWLRGAARMALATGAPLLPVRLLDTQKAFGPRAIAFPQLAALIGEPIAVERTEPTAELARELTDRLQATVESLGT